MSQRFILHAGDCLAVLDTLDENSVDAVVTDPPYHLTTGKKGGTGVASLNVNSPAGRSRISTGFMGKVWDGGDVAFRPETWAKVLRVLKPGGHLIAFGGTRTYHRLGCAIEDAGFEIREMHAWVFGSGFPKSLDVSKAIDKAAGAQREKIAVGVPVKRMIPGADQFKGGSWIKDNGREYQPGVELPATEDAKQWEGWGTATKPAMEPVCLARKPLSESTVAANVLRWGTGALNIDATRIGGEQTVTKRNGNSGGKTAFGRDERIFERVNPPGRWPANLCHDGSDEVLTLFPQSKGQIAAVGPQHGPKASVNTYGDYGPREQFEPRNDSGSAARFFYQAKASAKDRADSKHPTVKPVALMRQFVRLVTPPGGTVLDLFAGSGTTGQAAIEEGFNAVLIEQEDEYCADIMRRMNAVLAEHDADWPF